MSKDEQPKPGPAIPDDDTDTINLDELTEEERAAYLSSEDDDDTPEDAADQKDDDEGDDADDDDAEDAPEDDSEDAPVAEAEKGEAPEEDDAKPEPEVQDTPPRPVIEPKTFFTDEDQEALKKAQADLDKIDEDYDSGELTSAERKEKATAANEAIRELERKQIRAQTEMEAYQEAAKDAWFRSVDAWLAKHPEIPKEDDPAGAEVFDAFNDTVIAFAQAARPGTSPETILNRALTAFRDENPGALPDVPSPQKKVAPKAKAKKQRPALPPNIGNMPAADAPSENDGQWAALDRMAETDPLGYEKALAKLPDSEREAYMAST